VSRRLTDDSHGEPKKEDRTLKRLTRIKKSMQKALRSFLLAIMCAIICQMIIYSFLRIRGIYVNAQQESSSRQLTDPTALQGNKQPAQALSTKSEISFSNKTGSSSSPRSIDWVMAPLFHLAPPNTKYQEWVAPSQTILSPSDFLNHPFSSCCSHPYPPLDRTLRQVLNWPKGFFIESGGHDGMFQSNTLALEKFFGWRGLLIEPALKNIAKIQSNRNRSVAIHAGLLSQAQDGTKMSDPGGAPGGKIRTMKTGGRVPGRALSSLLDELNITSVDFWSLDVEGFEVPVLHGVDFSRHRPSFIVIEVWKQNRNDVFSIMAENRYTMVKGYDVEGGISGFPKGHRHRDFLWVDSRLGFDPQRILPTPVVAAT
jgi:FkbM family methyltransferase